MKNQIESLQNYNRQAQPMIRYRQDANHPQQAMIRYRQDANRPQQAMIRYRQDANHPQQAMIRYRQDANQQAQPMIRYRHDNLSNSESNFSESDQLAVRLELGIKKLIDIDGKEKALGVINNLIKTL